MGQRSAAIDETPGRGSWGLTLFTSRVLRIAGPAIAAQGRSTAQTVPAMVLMSSSRHLACGSDPASRIDPLMSFDLRPEQMCTLVGSGCVLFSVFRAGTPIRSSGVSAGSKLLHEVLAPALRRSLNFTGLTGSRQCAPLVSRLFPYAQKHRRKAVASSRNELLLRIQIHSPGAANPDKNRQFFRLFWSQEVRVGRT